MVTRSEEQSHKGIDDEELFEAIDKLISQGINAGDVKKLQDAGTYTEGIEGFSEAKICEAAEKIVSEFWLYHRKRRFVESGPLTAFIPDRISLVTKIETHSLHTYNLWIVDFVIFLEWISQEEVNLQNGSLSGPPVGVLVSDPKKPAGGHVVAHAAMIKLIFREGNGDQRVCKVFDDQNLPESEAMFQITTGGISDSKDQGLTGDRQRRYS